MTQNRGKRPFGIPRSGGLSFGQAFFGLRDIKGLSLSLDIVFVSIDTEVSGQERVKPGVPLVKVIGIATFDTRHLKCLAPATVATRYISTEQFSTSHASKDSFDGDVMDFKECVFAKTSFVPQKELPATIAK